MIPGAGAPPGPAAPLLPERRPAAPAPGTVPSPAALAFAALLDQSLAPPRPGDDGVTEVLQRSFRLAVLEALRSVPPALAPLPGPAPPPPAPAASVLPAEAVHGSDPVAGEDRAPAAAPAPAPAGGASDEDAAIRGAAARAGVDPAFLWALRRTENGGPGREFGVLSVPAPTYEEQVRVAAESVRRSIERFERAGGRAADPDSGRYTEAFVRFFSRRYAPVGAANDPAGLNRHHAGNLLRLYAPLDTRA